MSLTQLGVLLIFGWLVCAMFIARLVVKGGGQ